MVGIEENRMSQKYFYNQIKIWASDFRNGNSLNEKIIWIALLYNTTIPILTHLEKCSSKMTEIQFKTSIQHLQVIFKNILKKIFFEQTSVKNVQKETIEMFQRPRSKMTVS